MKEVKRYQAEDGRIFDNAEDAVKHDAKCATVKELAKLLKPIPENDGCAFANGSGFVRQDPLKVQEYKRQIMLLGKDLHCNMEKRAANPIEVHPQSIVGRILSDCDNVLYGAWRRVMCMDDQFREWGQPYFALHPEEGKQVELAA